MLGLDKGFTIYDPRDTGAVKPAYVISLRYRLRG
jgi:hypothetical protein